MSDRELVERLRKWSDKASVDLERKTGNTPLSQLRPIADLIGTSRAAASRLEAMGKERDGLRAFGQQSARDHTAAIEELVPLRSERDRLREALTVAQTCMEAHACGFNKQEAQNDQNGVSLDYGIAAARAALDTNTEPREMEEKRG